jgi:hypothetical protein
MGSRRSTCGSTGYAHPQLANELDLRAYSHAVNHRIRSVLTGVLVLIAPKVVESQTAEPAPWGLFSVRFDTRTSDFIYAVYGYGHTFAMVGTLDNPRSGWTELLGAVGRTFAFGNGPTQTAAIGAARASDGWYAQVYYLPTIRRSKLRFRATSEWDFPFNRSGTTQFSLSPVSATVAVSKLVEAGVAMDVSAAQGESTSAALGPEIRVTIPNAVVGADAQQMLGSRANRLRVFFTTSF